MPGVRQGVIYPNLTGRNYKFQMEIGTTLTRSTNRFEVVAEGIQQLTTGEPFVDGLCGFKVTMRTGYAAGSSTATYTYTLSGVDIATTTVSGTGWITSATSRVEIDNAVLTVTDCLNWSFTADELRWYVDGVLQYTSGALTWSGSEYDARDNVVFHQAWYPQSSLPTYLLPAFEDSDSFSSGLSVGGGWQHKPGASWVSEAITIDAVSPPTVVCDCYNTMPSVGADPPDCFHTGITAFLAKTIVKTDLGIYTCSECTTGHAGIPAKLHVFTQEDTYLYGYSWIKIAPEDASMRDRTTDRKARCSDPLNDPSWMERPYTQVITTYTDPICHASHFKHVEKVDAENTYVFIGTDWPGTQTGNCPAGSEGEFGTIIPCWPTVRFICVYEGQTHVYWHVKPECTDDLTGGIHATRDKIGMVYAVVASSKHLDLRRFDFDGFSDSQPVIAGRTAIGMAQIAFHPSGWLGILFSDDGTIYQIKNYGYGNEGIWSTPVTVAPGTYLAYAIDLSTGIEYAAVYVSASTLWKCYRKKPEDTSFGFVANIITLAADTPQQAALEHDMDKGHTLCFMCNDNGTVKRLTSNDHGTTWTA